MGTCLNTCSSDADCNLSGGQCFDGLGFVPLRTCGCVQQQRNDTTDHFRCINTTAVTSFTRTLTYAETGGSFPSTWSCHNASRFCWAQSARTLLSSIDDTIFLRVSNTSTSANVSAAVVRWRCLDRVYRRAVGLTGIRTTLDEYCVQCDIGCGIHGSCDLESSAYNCTCYAGYGGDRCTDLLGAPPIAPLWDNYTFLLEPSVYNASRPCTQCSADERCFRDFATGTGRCYCDVGKLPTTNCTLTSTQALSDVLWNDSIRVNVTFSSSVDPRVQWISHTPSGALIAVYSDLNVSTDFTTYRVDSRNQLHATCSNASLFFWSGDPFTSCSGCLGVCGVYANCTLSDRYNGTCVCLSGWTGQRCTERVVPDANCSQNLCSAHGICIDRDSRCECDPPYVGDRNCSGLASTCSTTQCNGHGSCIRDNGGCNCSTTGFYGATCQWNATECRSLRCSDAGRCTTQLQGCTCDAYHAGVDCSLHECVGTNGSTFLSMPVTNCSSCEAGRNGSHCENVICNGNGTFTGGVCECKPLYSGPTCLVSTCLPHGRVIDGPPAARCNCTAPYVPSTATNLTTCVLVCLNGGVYNATADQCLCDEARYYGSRCQFAYPFVARPRDTQNFYILFVSSALVLWVMIFAVYAGMFPYFEIPPSVVLQNRHLIADLALQQQRMQEPKANKSMGYLIPLLSPGGAELALRLIKQFRRTGHV